MVMALTVSRCFSPYTEAHSCNKRSENAMNSRWKVAKLMKYMRMTVRMHARALSALNQTNRHADLIGLLEQLQRLHELPLHQLVLVHLGAAQETSEHRLGLAEAQHALGKDDFGLLLVLGACAEPVAVQQRRVGDVVCLLRAPLASPSHCKHSSQMSVAVCFASSRMCFASHASLLCRVDLRGTDCRVEVSVGALMSLVTDKKRTVSASALS